MTDLVLRSDSEGVATLTLNRPSKLNALNSGVFRTLRQQLDDIAQDARVRCVVLTGAGRAFCSGHDLTTLPEEPHDPSFEAETVDRLEQLPQPVIAAVRGYCFTGGLELALGCDLIIATEDAVLADTHSRFGLVPVWGMSVRLPERVGVSTAKLLSFTARRITATEALRIGLVDQVVPDGELADATRALARDIAANSPESLRIIKTLIRDGLDRNRQAALVRERSTPYGVPAAALDPSSRE